MKLNSQQQKAAEYGGGHVLVLAGAGTGKTRTIITRAAHLIRNSVPPKRILLLTFTRRAAREMTNRLKHIAGKSSQGMMAGTFHHFCLYTMRRHPKWFDIENATVIDRDDQIQLMKLARSDFIEKQKSSTKTSNKRKKKADLPKARTLVNLYSYARNTNRPVRTYLEEFAELDEAGIENALQISAAYEKRKVFNHYLDYDDILRHFAKRLHEVEKIRNHLRSLYDHILVDEMQDTNPLQWLILDGLRDPAKLFCVGDDAQSIYAFRGADFQNVHLFMKRIPDSTVLRLEQNYRSTQEILNVSNWLLGQSPLKYGKKLTAHRGKGAKPQLIDFDEDFDEAEWIAEDLVERHEGGSAWREHMILTRTAWGARALEAALVERNIPYVFIGGTQLMQSAHVKDLLCLVRAAASHYDELAWMRYLTLYRGIGSVTAGRLITQMQSTRTINDALSVLAENVPKQPKIVQGPQLILKNWKRPSMALHAGASFLEPMLSEIYERWDARKKDFDLLIRLAENHHELIDFLETYALNPISTTQASRPEQDDVVTVITVHSAKGTEASVCYLIRVQPGVYPHVRSLGKEDTEEEERRILYVAMTRAKDELILTRTCSYFGQRVFYGGAMGDNSPNGTAYFLDTLPDKLVDTRAEGFELDEFDEIVPWDHD
ncbi:ATP-dependent helicase [Planctomycetota bacterium]